MRVALISDVHLSDDDEVQAALVAWMDALDVDRLGILGDLFHHWWGFPGHIPDGLRPVCDALLRLRDRGVPIFVVPGNHDFALGPFFHETLGADVRGVHVQTFDGVRFLLAHGDEADDTLGYRLARGVLRGRPFAALMGALGPVRGERLLRRLAGASRTHPAEPGPLLDRQRTWAGRWLGTEADVAVMGHVHHPGIVEVEGGCVVHLGGWDLDRTWCLVEDGVPRLVRADLPPGPPSPPGAD